MTPDDAYAEVVMLVELAQRTIGGDWEKIDGGLQGCGLPSGNPGVTQGAVRLGPGIPKAGQKAILDQIIQEWSDAGFPPTVIKLPEIQGVFVTQLRYPASGRGEDGIFLEVQVADTASTVDSRARCVPRMPEESDESPAP